MLFRLLGAYNRLLVRRPLVTQSGTAAVLYAVGDTLAQSIENKGDAGKFDRDRLVRMTAIGGLALGPSMSIWYRFLDRRIILQSHTLSTVVRVLADQLVFAPVSILGLFGLSELTQRNGASVQQRLQKAKERLEDTFVPVLLQNYKLWPAVQMVNFFFVPLRLRLLVSNTVAIFWSAYLSSTVNNASRVEDRLEVLGPAA